MQCFSVLLIFILIFIIGYIVFALQPEEVSDDLKVTKKRLLKIKNKEYDTPAAKVVEGTGQNLMKAILNEEEYSFAFLGKFLEKYDFMNKFKRLLKLANIKQDISQFIVMNFVVGLVLGLIAFFIFTGQNFVTSMILGLLGAVVPPFIVIKMKAGKRLNLFTAQLPDALALIASSLRAGHSLPSAFTLVTQELPEPVCSVFRSASEDINLGRSTKEALDTMTSLMPGSIDLRFFVTAVLIQREIGGNLAEILDSLNNTIRERFKLLGQLKSQTAQASLSGLILALAPVFIGGVIYLLNPQYMEPLFTSSLGKMAIGLAVFLGIVGFLIIRKITNIRV